MAKRNGFRSHFNGPIRCDHEVFGTSGMERQMSGKP